MPIVMRKVTDWCYYSNWNNEKGKIEFDVTKRIVYYIEPNCNYAGWNRALLLSLELEEIPHQVIWYGVPANITQYYWSWSRNVIVPAFQNVDYAEVKNHFMPHPDQPDYICKINYPYGIDSEEGKKKGLVGLYTEWKPKVVQSMPIINEIPIGKWEVCNLGEWEKKNDVTIEAIPRKMKGVQSRYRHDKALL